MLYLCSLPRAFCIIWLKYCWNTITLPLDLTLHCVQLIVQLKTKLCDKVCQLFAAGQSFSLGTPVSSTNKTDGQDIAEILFLARTRFILVYKITFKQYFIFLARQFQNVFWGLLITFNVSLRSCVYNFLWLNIRFTILFYNFVDFRAHFIKFLSESFLECGQYIGVAFLFQFLLTLFSLLYGQVYNSFSIMHHNIGEILLKLVLNTNQSINHFPLLN